MNNINKIRIESRVLEVANYVIETGNTVREAAKEFGVSKATVYIDITKRILEISPFLAKETEKVLLYNKSQRHLRGGRITKKKFERGLSS